MIRVEFMRAHSPRTRLPILLLSAGWSACVLAASACGAPPASPASPVSPAPAPPLAPVAVTTPMPPLDAGSPVIQESPEAYLDRPLREQVVALERGSLSSAALTTAYLARIAARDPGDGGVHAVLVTDPQAATKAATIDGLRGKGALLQGAAILVKDNIDSQGIATTAGSLALANNVPAADAFVLRRIHAAQAVMLGKTNLSEWANFRSTKSTSGWSSVGGQTFNGRDRSRNPCGSSSGSGAAIAAGLASAALGSETDGSIVCPASVNGVVGFKPTVGLVSRAGVVPISSSQDTVGPITRSVGDAARLLSVMAGPDPDDAATSAIPAGMSLDFEKDLPAASLGGVRLAFVKSFGFGPEVMKIFDAKVERLKKAGATVVTATMDVDSWSADEQKVLLLEFADGIESYLAAHPVPGQSRTLADLIAFNTAHASTVMPHFGQELFLQSRSMGGTKNPGYAAARRSARDKSRLAIDKLLAAGPYDAIISPTMDPAWPIAYGKGDPPTLHGNSSPAAAAGYPHLTVPMGNVGGAGGGGSDGLPVGLSFIGSAWQDAKILALGYAYEQLR